MNISSALVALIASYLMGAVPFGLLFARIFSNVDVRNMGSGNIGATNVLRSSGKTAAGLTLLMDMLKGYIPVIAAGFFLKNEAVTALCGAAAVLGHNFPLYLGFKGGKGVATGFGVILGVSPFIGFACLSAWLVAALIWKYSSLSAIVAYATYPVLTFFFHPGSRPLRALSLFIAAMIYIRHRANIKRLLDGTEPHIGRGAS